MLGQQEEAPYEPKDLRALLDRVAATLGKLPAPRARRALIEHAGKKQPQLGDTDRADLRALGPGHVGGHARRSSSCSRC